MNKQNRQLSTWPGIIISAYAVAGYFASQRFNIPGKIAFILLLTLIGFFLLEYVSKLKIVSRVIITIIPFLFLGTIAYFEDKDITQDNSSTTYSSLHSNILYGIWKSKDDKGQIIANIKKDSIEISTFPKTKTTVFGYYNSDKDLIMSDIDDNEMTWHIVNISDTLLNITIQNKPLDFHREK